MAHENDDVQVSFISSCPLQIPAHSFQGVVYRCSPVKSRKHPCVMRTPCHFSYFSPKPFLKKIYAATQQPSSGVLPRWQDMKSAFRLCQLGSFLRSFTPPPLKTNENLLKNYGWKMKNPFKMVPFQGTC